jgi:hypothetical protein
MPTIENLKFKITDRKNKWVEVVGVKKTNVETVIIPSSITTGGEEYEVTSIGKSAFWGCDNLTSINIPSSVTSIGGWAFVGRDNLTSINIPSSVTSIGKQAFYDCSSLTSITIPSSVTSIGDEAFASCDNLAKIKVDSGNPVYDSRDNCNAAIETKSNTLIAGCAPTIIPSSVISIGKCAFKGCSSLTSITIPSSVTSIGYTAFSWCKSLTSITIPSSVTSIGEEAFRGCVSLTSITIPTHIMNIDELDIPKATRIIRENV